MENRLTSQTFASRASPVTEWQRLQQGELSLIRKNQLALTEKATFTFIPALSSAALPTQGAEESLLSLCTQIKLCRNSTVSCQNIQLQHILHHCDTGKQPPANPYISEQTYLRKILIIIFSCPSF